MILPQEYIIQKYYQYAGYPKFKKYTNTYEAGCPLCREGRSWGKKRRSYYLVDKNIICCHNCGWYSQPLKWIETVSGLEQREIIKESTQFDVLPIDLLADNTAPKKQIVVDTLPKDSINLFDSTQVNYYKDNAIIKSALKLIADRRIDKAINRPDTLWISLVDKVHKNRLIIPFYNENNEIIFYQSRIILKNDQRFYPKYLSKINSEKSLYNINKISSELDYIFIFEGPIDSFFVINGTAVAGIQENSETSFTRLQQEQLRPFSLYKKIWVLDSQWLDMASRSKTNKLINSGETVFIWPEEIGKTFKDINDVVISKNLNALEPSFIIENSFSGLKAQLMLVEINRWRC